MLRSVQIAGFRGFERFELHDLGRVNLLVGANNSGKTALLEAIEVLAASHPVLVAASMRRRGEWIVRGSGVRLESEFDIRRLFHGFVLEEHKKFELSGVDDSRGALRVSGELLRRTLRPRPGDLLDEVSLAQQQKMAFIDEGFIDEGFLDVPSRAETIRDFWELRVGFGEESTSEMPVSEQGGVSPRFFRGREPASASKRTVFVPTSSLSPLEIIQGAEAIQLKPEEQLVLDTLRLIDPRIQAYRVHSNLRIVSNNPSVGREGIIVKLDGFEDPVPIGSFGEGVYRLLGLALALASSRGGVLLVDEIDTGLHHTVMDKMWRMVKQTADRLDVQVFATTHSRDCYQSLATIVDPSGTGPSQVTIQRIEPGSRRSVSFSEQEIALAAERGLEIR